MMNRGNESKPQKEESQETKKAEKDDDLKQITFNGFSAFLSEQSPKMRLLNPKLTDDEVTKLIRSQWSGLPEDEKKKYASKAENVDTARIVEFSIEDHNLKIVDKFGGEAKIGDQAHGAAEVKQATTSNTGKTKGSAIIIEYDSANYGIKIDNSNNGEDQKIVDLKIGQEATFIQNVSLEQTKLRTEVVSEFADVSELCDDVSKISGDAKDEGEVKQDDRNKMFVDHIPDWLENEEIKAYFESFGSVKTVSRGFDKEKGEMERVAIVAFNDKLSVDKCLFKRHLICGKDVVVKRFVPINEPFGGVAFKVGGRTNMREEKPSKRRRAADEKNDEDDEKDAKRKKSI